MICLLSWFPLMIVTRSGKRTFIATTIVTCGSARFVNVRSQFAMISRVKNFQWLKTRRFCSS